LIKNGFVSVFLSVPLSAILTAFLKGNKTVPASRIDADNMVAIGTILRLSPLAKILAD